MIATLTSACNRLLGLLRRGDWVGPLLARLTLGLVFVTAGWGKLHNLDHVTQFFESLDIPAPQASATLVSWVELVGGALLIAGLATRVAALFLVAVMAVAIGTAKLPELHGIIDLVTTIEVVYLAAFVWLVVAGGGRVSLDHAIARWRKRDVRTTTADAAAIA
ncbi:MAG: DoxX family protein [Kofleriaceae bacterium]